MSNSSRFGYLRYDGKASDSQNNLRRLFRTLESQVNLGIHFGVSALEIPANEYFSLAKHHQHLIIDNLLSTNPSRKLERQRECLISLEVLYFLLGKAVRIDCMKRVPVSKKV